MNPYQHAQISVKKRGGVIEDYYPIHFFMDATKELCSDLLLSPLQITGKLQSLLLTHNSWFLNAICPKILGHLKNWNWTSRRY